MPSPFPIRFSFAAASVNRKILSAAMAVSAATILVKLLATMKEVAVADVYGRSDALDAFLAASLIPALLVNLISESMNQALVPTFIRVREEEGQAKAQQLLSASMFWMCLMLVVVSAALALTAHGFFPLIASHFAPAKLELSIKIFYALLPLVLITGIATNCTSVLNTAESFALPAIVPIVTPIAVLAGVLAFGSRLGIWAMVYATLAGALIHAVVVWWLMEARGYRLRLCWQKMTAASREVASQYWPVLLSGIVASGGLLVDQSMAAMLAPGSVSALAYANRFVSVVLTLSAGAVSTALTPYFSEMIAAGDWARCRSTIVTWAKLTALISAPVAVGLIAGSAMLIRAIFQYGAFGQRDTAVVAPVLAMYALQIPFFVSSRVFYRFLVAMRRTDLVLYCGILNLVLDVVLNLILMRWMGVAGIALATSLWTVSTFLFLWYWTWRVLPRAGTGEAAA